MGKISTWPLEYIGNIFDFKNGLNKGKNFFGKGTPIINYVDVYSQKGLHAEQIKGKVTLSPKEIERFSAQKGDVFFTRTSETPDEVGYAAVLLDDISKCTFSGFVLRARPKKVTLLPEYCQYCFQTEAIRNAIILGCTYTTRALTNGRQLSKILIPVPPHSEQKAIAEALSDIDRLIAATEKLIAKKKAIKQGLMQELLTGKRRLPGFTKPWVKPELGDLCKIHKGTQINKSALKPQGTYYVMNGGVEPSGYTDSWNTPENTISISEGGNSCGFVQFNKSKFWSGGHCYTLECRDSVNMLFLYQWLKNAQPLIMKLRIGTGLPNIQREALERFSCFIPDDDHEQKEISKILFEFDFVVENLENALSKYRKIKQGMMSELLTGRIRLLDRPIVENHVSKSIPESSSHNEQFDDAVMISAIVNAFYSPRYPLGRKKIQKLLYLARRYQNASTDGFLKKAAGPYKPSARYSGGERIAVSSHYIQESQSDKGSIFAPGAKIQTALDYSVQWNLGSVIEWLLQNFKFTKVDDLEVLATVDMAICDLRTAGILVSLDTVKKVISRNREWEPKLKKTYFGDKEISRAIVKLNDIIGSESWT